MHDIFLLLKLKIRHLQSALSLIVGGMLGMDFVNDREASERLYQLYATIILAVCLVLLWFALEYYASLLALYLGSHNVILIFQAALFIAPLVFALGAARYLRACPIALTLPDISYIAASPVCSFSVVLYSMSGRLIITGFLGFLAGYLLGVMLQSGLAINVSAFSFGLLFLLLMIAALLGSWIVGTIRLSTNKPKRFLLLLGSVAAMIIAFAVPAYAMFSGYLPDVNAIKSVLTTDFLNLCGILIIAIVTELVVLRLKAPLILMDKVIDENALYAELNTLRLMAIYDMSGYNELRRRKRIASRIPKIFLPIKSGAAALISRSILTHLRQPGGLANLALWGAFAAPTAIYLLVETPSVFLWLIWAIGLINFSAGAREITRAFREDIQNKSIRSNLPFSTLQILLYDTIPTGILVSLVSFVVIIAVWAQSPLLVWSILVSLLINIVLTLCVALECLKITAQMRQLSFEVIFLVIAAILFAVSLFKSLVLVILALVLIGLALVIVVRLSKD